jgi:hypothetical protein
MTDDASAKLPRYRVLTGKDDASFCHRVSEALDLGYILYGSPAITFDGQNRIVAQAMIRSAERSEPSS